MFMHILTRAFPFPACEWRLLTTVLVDAEIERFVVFETCDERFFLVLLKEIN
jgi:hypothetical protein